jgi:hypothetical protein
MAPTTAALPGRAILQRRAAPAGDPALLAIQRRAAGLRADLERATLANQRTVGEGFAPICVVCYEGLPCYDEIALLPPTEPRLDALAAALGGIPGWARRFGSRGRDSVAIEDVAIVCLDCADQFETLHAYGPDLYPAHTYLDPECHPDEEDL